MMLGGKRALAYTIRLIASSTSEGSSTISFSAATAGDIGILVVNHASGAISTPSGWTKIVALTNGSIYANTMAGGETSVVFTGPTVYQIGIAFFRGCSEPTTGEGTYAVSITNPDPPVSVVSAVPADIALAICAAQYATESIGANVPSGYTQVFFSEAADGRKAIAMGYITGQTGTVNPGEFNWGLASSVAGASTIILEKA